MELADKSIEIEIAPSELDVFNELLQSGFMVNTKSGDSIEEFLCDQVGVDAKYLMERVKTVFLDSRPVDELDTAVLHDGSKLTLSGGMPGLVGMTLGRGSILASFRSGITYRGDDDVKEGAQADVNVKLFNIVMKDRGGLFLKYGINVKGSGMASQIEKLRLEPLAKIMSIKLDGNATSLDKLPAQLEAVDGWIRLSITSG